MQQFCLRFFQPLNARSLLMLVICGLSAGLIWDTRPVLAQSPDAPSAAPTPEFTPEPTPEPTTAPALDSTINPLEPQPDPLLPQLVVDRPLSPQEKDVLRAALVELQAQAEAAVAAGNLPEAWQLFNRELRLRRYLSPREEVAALTRVGSVAWRESQSIELRFITLRLEQIQQEAGIPTGVTAAKPVAPAPVPTDPPAQIDYDLLLEIAQAYQQVRARDQAVALYQTLFERAKQQEDTAQQQQILLALAEIQLAWFDYPNAAVTYEELLTLARATNDRPQEIDALTQLAYVYQENSQPEQAVLAQQQLVEIYQRQNKFLPIPAIKLAMGNSYAQLNRPDLAATSYQEAFATARSVQQYAYAADALQRLAALYQTLNRPADALVVYQLLLDVNRQSYNSFGMMNTYDQIGQLYQVQGDRAQAVAAFQQGLQLAQQLNYRVEYFDGQVQQVSQ